MPKAPSSPRYYSENLPKRKPHPSQNRHGGECHPSGTHPDAPCSVCLPYLDLYLICSLSDDDAADSQRWGQHIFRADRQRRSRSARPRLDSTVDGERLGAEGADHMRVCRAFDESYCECHKR